MSRKTTHRKPPAKSPTITLKVGSDLNQRIRAAVKVSDLDISKFARAALREKLDRLGI